MNDDQLLGKVGTWLKDSDTARPDVVRITERAMGQVAQTRPAFLDRVPGGAGFLRGVDDRLVRTVGRVARRFDLPDPHHRVEGEEPVAHQLEGRILLRGSRPTRGTSHSRPDDDRKSN